MLDVGENFGVYMKSTVKLYVATLIFLLIFGAMFLGAIAGEISGNLSKNQVTSLINYSLPFLGMAAIAIFGWCTLENRTCPH